MQNQNTSQQLQSQQQQQQQQQQQHMSSLPANYTLPGVINYLTSEFTNLERFKIMTNLEKSEMKYKINQLQGEVNALKYLGERQSAKIGLLESENALLKEKLASGSVDGSGSTTTADSTSTAAATAPKGTHPAGSRTGGGSAAAGVVSLPEIDLSVVKKSREQLTRAMKEVVYLLRTPSPNGYHYLNLPDPSSTSAEMNDSSQFDELFNSPIDGHGAFPLGNELDLSPPPAAAAASAAGAAKAKSGAPGFSKYLYEESKKIQKNNGGGNSSGSSSAANAAAGAGSGAAKDAIDTDLFGEIVKMEDKSSKGKGVQAIDDEDDDSNDLPSDAETVTYETDNNEFSFLKSKSGSGSANNSPIGDVDADDNDDVVDEGAPGVTLSTYMEGFSSSKVFPGMDDGILVYINYNKTPTASKSSGSAAASTIWLNVYDTNTNTTVMSTSIPLDDPSAIVDIHCLTGKPASSPVPLGSAGSAGSALHFIIVYNFGSIECISIPRTKRSSGSSVSSGTGGGTSTTIITRSNLLSLKGLKINCTSVVDFANRATKNKKFYGLTFTTHHKENNGQLRVFQICVDSSGATPDASSVVAATTPPSGTAMATVSIKDIGTYARNLFGGPAGTSKVFEVINWFQEPPNGATGSSSSSSSNAFYSPIVQVNDRLVKVNLSSMAITTLSTSHPSIELPPSLWGLLTYGKYTLLRKGNEAKVELFDIASQTSVAASSKISLENSVVIRDDKGTHRVVTLEIDAEDAGGSAPEGTKGGVITIFDEELNTEFRLEVGGLQGGELGRCGGKVILLDNNIINLIEIPQ